MGGTETASGWQQVTGLARTAGAGAEVLVDARLIGIDRQWGLDAERLVPAASTIKTAILVTLYRATEAGQIGLDEMLVVTSELRVPGSGVLAWMTPGLALPLTDLAYLMIAISDNTASNLLLDALGIDRVQATIAELGLTRTVLHRPFLGRAPRSGEPDNLTCAGDLCRLLTAIAEGTAASAASCERMRATLALQQDRSRLARWLPPDARFAGKSGTLPGIVHDTGLLDTRAGPLAVAVLTQGISDPYEAEATIGRIALALIDEATAATSRS